MQILTQLVQGGAWDPAFLTTLKWRRSCLQPTLGEQNPRRPRRCSRVTRVRLSSSDLSRLNVRIIWGLKSLDAQAAAQRTESAGAVRFGAPGGRLVQLGWPAFACSVLPPPTPLSALKTPSPAVRVSSKAPGPFSIIAWLSAAAASRRLIESAGEMSWAGRRGGE